MSARRPRPPATCRLGHGVDAEQVRATGQEGLGGNKKTVAIGICLDHGHQSCGRFHQAAEDRDVPGQGRPVDLDGQPGPGWLQAPRASAALLFLRLLQASLSLQAP